VSDVALKLSRDLRGIADVIATMIEGSCGEKVAFSLLVYTPGRASYISSATRETTVPELRKLLKIWESNEPDVPAHEVD
jgi:hypothetical protein